MVPESEILMEKVCGGKSNRRKLKFPLNGHKLEVAWQLRLHKNFWAHFNSQLLGIGCHCSRILASVQKQAFSDKRMIRYDLP